MSETTTETMRPRRGPAFVLAAGLATLAAACEADGVGTGTFELRVSGEAAAKTGFPYTRDGMSVGLVDGWTVRFTRFVVSLGEIRLRTSGGEEAFASAQNQVADLVQGDPTVLTVSGLAARRWDRFGFNIVPVGANPKVLNDVPGAEIEAMRAAGANYLVQGSAEKDGARYTFRWLVKAPTRNSSCTNGVDNTDGFVVRNNATTTGEITIHIDHMFWDTLGTERSRLRFEAIAAAAGEDRVVTWDALATQRLAELRGVDGMRLRDETGAPLVYNPGAVPLPASNLQEFIAASMASMGHVNGTGLCTVNRL
jgi:hypothetical protein